MDVNSFLLEENGPFPNNGSLPLLRYGKVYNPEDFAPDTLAKEFEELFAANNWPPAWRNGIFSVHHYHSTAHEALGVYSGSARDQFGGNGGQVVEVVPGDVVVVPAGVAHKLISSDGRLGIVGAYPEGQSPDMCYGTQGERPDADKRISSVPLPELDPVLGNSDATTGPWKK